MPGNELELFTRPHAGKTDPDRDARALRMRVERRWTYAQIASHLGYADESGAFYAVKRARKARYQPETGNELRDLELDNLDEIEAVAMKIASTFHPAINHGRVMTVPDPNTGVPVILEDDTIKLQAIATVLAIKKRRADLTGADAPRKTEIRNVDAIDARITELVDEMADADPRPAQTATQPA